MVEAVFCVKWDKNAFEKGVTRAIEHTFGKVCLRAGTEPRPYEFCSRVLGRNKEKAGCNTLLVSSVIKLL